MYKTLLFCASFSVLGLSATPPPTLKNQQNQFNDRLQMQQRELQQHQQSRTPAQPALIQPVRSDILQNPTPHERHRIQQENQQRELQHRQQQIAPPPAPKPAPRHPQVPPPPPKRIFGIRSTGFKHKVS